MVARLCVGLGEFLAFAAMVLAILVNMGQISNNIVARNIYYAELETTGFDANLRAAATVPLNTAFAAQQDAPELANNGLKFEYRWGLYNFCAGSTDGKTRSCGPRGFAKGRFEPAQVLYADLAVEYQPALNGTISSGTFRDSDYLGKFSHAAFWLIFIGTVLSGLSFLTGFLAKRFAFALAAVFALAAAAALGCGAAIYTAILVKARSSLDGVDGLELHLTNALWMMWAAFGASVLSIIPLILACCTGRESKY